MKPDTHTLENTFPEQCADAYWAGYKAGVQDQREIMSTFLAQNFNMRNVPKPKMKYNETEVQKDGKR